MTERTVRTGFVTYVDEGGTQRHATTGETIRVHADHLERFDQVNGGAPRTEEGSAEEQGPLSFFTISGTIVGDMAPGDDVIQPEPASINVAELISELYPDVPQWQLQQWANAIRRELREKAAEHEERRLSQRIEAVVAEISPELARKIDSLPTAELKERYLNVVAAIIELVSALAELYNTPPDPQTITRLVINIEGPDVEAVIVPPSPQEDDQRGE